MEEPKLITPGQAAAWFCIACLAFAAMGLTAAAVRGPSPPGMIDVRPLSASGAKAVVVAAASAPFASSSLSRLPEGEAQAWNRALPFSDDPIRPASPFIAADAPQAYDRALECLTAAIHYEAASESDAGQAAVAQVVLNRVRHPAFPGSVCGVVFQGAERPTGCQFTFTCDGAMGRPPSGAAWARARRAAAAALNGSVMQAVGMATHYHADWVVPYWAPRLSKTVQVGSHIFYRWRGAWGLPGAFESAARDPEPVVQAMIWSRGAPVPPVAEPVASPAPAPIETLSYATLTTVRIDAPSPRILVAIVDPAEGEPGVELRSTASAPLAASVDIMPDPLAGPIDPPSRRRQKIAAPSQW